MACGYKDVKLALEKVKNKVERDSIENDSLLIEKIICTFCEEIEENIYYNNNSILSYNLNKIIFIKK